MDIPEAVIDRLAGVPKEKAADEGMQIALETIAELRRMPGVAGVHIMAIEAEDRVGPLVTAAGLTPRPQV
jgi:methylenetetrahydrofolate reductase (NADPH)